MNTFTTTLIKKQQLTSDVYSFIFKLNDCFLNYLPGQYVGIKLLNVTRLYSIASYRKNTKEFELIIKIIPQGVAGKYFNNIKEGEKVDFFGPYGNFVIQKNIKDKIFIATGVGIAPILAILDFLDVNKNILYWGQKKKEDLFYLDRLDSKKNNLELKICLSQEEDSHFLFGRVNKHLILSNSYDYYLCGSNLIVESIRNFLIKNGILKENIFIEKY